MENTIENEMKKIDCHSNKHCCCNETEYNSEDYPITSEVSIDNERGKKTLVTRVNMINGSLAGVSKMIQENRNCNEILIQLSAIDKSIKSLANKIIETHFNSVVVDEIKNGNTEVLAEIVELFKRFQ